MKIFIHSHMNTNKISKNYNKILKNQTCNITFLKNITTFIQKILNKHTQITKENYKINY